MKILKVGDIVKNRRIHLRISQEEICNGLCEISTLSRLENNKHLPSVRIFGAIIERLGLPNERFFALGSSEDFIIQELCNEIHERQAAGYAETTQPLIEQLEKLNKLDESPLRQLTLRAEALLEKDKIDGDAFFKKILEALLITCPDFDVDTFENNFFSAEEMRCIADLGKSYEVVKDYVSAIKIYQKALTVLERNWVISDEKEKDKYISSILLHLAESLICQSKYLEALSVCDKAICMCIDMHMWDNLPEFYICNGRIYCHMGRHDEAKHMLKIAYYMFVGVGDFAAANHMTDELKSLFDIEL